MPPEGTVKDWSQSILLSVAGDRIYLSTRPLTLKDQ